MLNQPRRRFGSCIWTAGLDVGRCSLVQKSATGVEQSAEAPTRPSTGIRSSCPWYIFVNDTVVRRIETTAAQTRNIWFRASRRPLRPYSRG